MIKGIANQSLVAVRREPSESSEMINQLLFGETFTIIENYSSWFRIISNIDSYEGWIDNKLVELLPDDSPINNANPKVANSLFLAKKKIKRKRYENGHFIAGADTYQCIENPISEINSNNIDELIRVAKLFVNSPYLWGGRSPYGIDCSGFTQVVFKIVGHSIPRDAGQQVKLGETVDFVNMAQPGDLAFFDNDEEIITHVGIIIDNGKIIHSSGYVKIESIDHQGIFSVNTQKYSHKLRVIKRIL